MTAEKNNKEILEHTADFYDVAKDFDYFNTKLASRIICPECSGKDVLEVGCASGIMTEDLIEISKTLTVVEPSSKYCDMIKQRFGDRLKTYNCFLEDLDKNHKYEVIVLASLLHHLENPEKFLETTKKFTTKNGFILATVPNVKSLHRRIGAKAGLLKNEYDSSERNKKFHQPGRFDKTSFENLFKTCSFKVLESMPYMLKSFSSEQMLKLNLDWNIINSLFELGKEYPSLASQLYIKATM
jgi:2-polyprenyl-3-methyl-5-hydroxy-6-metoxy-1,4-benzoquinol methylase